MKKSMPDVIISIVLLGFLISLSAQVPEIPEVSRTYPLFLIGVCYVMTIILLIKSLMKLKAETPMPTEVGQQAKIIVPYCVMIALYLFLMGKIGYILSTILFMMVSFIYLRLKSKILMVVISILMTLVLYLVFTNILVVILPKGDWINLAF